MNVHVRKDARVPSARPWTVRGVIDRCVKDRLARIGLCERTERRRGTAVPVQETVAVIPAERRDMLQPPVPRWAISSNSKV